MSDIKSVLSGLKRISNDDAEWASHHYIVLSQLNKWINSHAVKYAKGDLFDFGCGGQPYRNSLLPYIKSYLGADVASAEGVSLDLELIPGECVPLPDASFDTVLSTQTLEHVYDFHQYLDDCSRLLRSEGRLIITVPMQWRHHEVPYDYWRFTRFGLARALEDSGFIVDELVPCGGVYSLIGQIYLSHLSERGRLRPWLTKLINWLFLRLDSGAKDYDDTLVWMCLATKK